MATWIVKIDGFRAGKYIETKKVKGRDVVVVSWSAYIPNNYYDINKYRRNIKEIPIEYCTILRKPSPREVDLRFFFVRLFKGYIGALYWRESYMEKYE